MGVILPGVERDFPPVFSWDWDGKRLKFVMHFGNRRWAPGLLHYVQEPLIIAYSLPIKGNTLIFINSYVRTAVIKLRWALFVTYTIIQSITSSKMCSLHLTHPSAHTLGAVGSRRCGTRGAVGGSVPCSNVLPQSWTIPAGAEIWTHNLGLQVQHSIH